MARKSIFLKRKYILLLMATITLLWCHSTCRAQVFFAAPRPAVKIFNDTTSKGRPVIHHRFEGGVLCQVGKQYARTYNDYEGKTTPAYNYAINQYDRFIALRMQHDVCLKNVISAGIAYGVDLHIQPHYVKALVPLMGEINSAVLLAKNVGFTCMQRVGYAFFVHTANNNATTKPVGPEGGFASETIVGASFKPKKYKHLVGLQLGYRLQHIRSKNIFYPDQTLVNLNGLPVLPPKITEIQNVFCSFIYASININF